MRAASRSPPLSAAASPCRSGTPPDLIGALVDAMRAVAQDDAFRDQAEANGYYASWADGPDWLKQMQTEQAELAKLWETNPWLSSSGG